MTENGKALLSQYMAVYRAVCEQLERSTGKKPVGYKPMETGRLVKFFNALERKETDAFSLVVHIASALIADQALPNANHRTTLMYVGIVLNRLDIGLGFDLERHDKRISRYISDSKAILAVRATNKRYKADHLAMTKEFLLEMLGPSQSGRLGKMSSTSFMTSLSDSSKDLTGLSGSAMDEE